MILTRIKQSPIEAVKVIELGFYSIYKVYETKTLNLSEWVKFGNPMKF